MSTRDENRDLNMLYRSRDIDLHVHSLVSDGSFQPEELAGEAKRQGLKAFALTDHDSIAGNAEAAEAAREAGIGFLPGMEMSVEYKGRQLHIVCLGFDEEHPSFQRMYRWVRSVKEGKIPEIIHHIRQKGIKISLEDVEKHAYGHPMDRYAVMRYMVSLHMYERAQPIWDNYLNPAVAELGLNINVTAEEALPVIHEAGGITSLAHYHKNIGLKGMTRAEQEKAIVRLHGMGLDGMERWYPNYSEEDMAFANAMIEKYHLLPTAGTDFHGKNRPDVEMGHGIKDNMAVPYHFFENLLLHCRKYILPKGFSAGNGELLSLE